MITATSVNSRAIAVAAASLIAAGCATTQTAAFRAMTAEEHETAGSVGGSADDAAAHLAAARGLRRAEQVACFEVPDVQRDAGPFARKDQIVGVEPLQGRPNTKAAQRPVGVAVYLRATPGMTEQWIGRVIECHLAHRAVVGTRVAEQACPLATEEAQIDVSSTDTGFRVSITSKDVTVARSLIDRCHALVD
jgi:hypothetical protein